MARFVCADPEKMQKTGGRRKTHPRWWQVEAQSILRAYRPHQHGVSRMILGLRQPSNDLVALGLWEPQRGVGDVRVVLQKALGVVLSVQGTNVAGELYRYRLERILHDTSHQKPAPSVLLVQSRIHARNIPSQRLATRFGFAYDHILSDERAFEATAGADFMQVWTQAWRSTPGTGWKSTTPPAEGVTLITFP
ncbi:hypothetical protein OG218_01080 [Kineococcus sp. NBC_00420]|uniref:hypothetical protein n=1 Tax=Kineococcus sp. NBC_00420 TaxID=2903564 RepID=UPI002E1E015F